MELGCRQVLAIVGVARCRYCASQGLQFRLVLPAEIDTEANVVRSVDRLLEIGRSCPWWHVAGQRGARVVRAHRRAKCGGECNGGRDCQALPPMAGHTRNLLTGWQIQGAADVTRTDVTWQQIQPPRAGPTPSGRSRHGGAWPACLLRSCRLDYSLGGASHIEEGALHGAGDHRCCPTLVRSCVGLSLSSTASPSSEHHKARPVSSRAITNLCI